MLIAALESYYNTRLDRAASNEFKAKSECFLFNHMKWQNCLSSFQLASLSRQKGRLVKILPGSHLLFSPRSLHWIMQMGRKGSNAYFILSYIEKQTSCSQSHGKIRYLFFITSFWSFFESCFTCGDYNLQEICIPPVKDLRYMSKI